LDKLLFDSKEHISNEKKIEWIHEIANGMCHLHKFNIVHRDLASQGRKSLSQENFDSREFGQIVTPNINRYHNSFFSQTQYFNCLLEKQLVLNNRLKVFCSLSLIVVMFLHLSVGLLNFVTETQQQQKGNITHTTTTTLSQARYLLVSTSSGELVFVGGRNGRGVNSQQFISIEMTPTAVCFNSTQCSGRGYCFDQKCACLPLFGGCFRFC
jgi:hypothetical protein